MSAEQVGVNLGNQIRLVWSICTQYRHAGCEHLRIRRRLRISVGMVRQDEPEIVARTEMAV